MKAYRRMLLAAMFVAVSVISASAQLGTGGDVVDVVDGKTVIVAVPSGRFTIQLQYIDAPEPAQPLHNTVKDHLRKMLVGRSVEIRTTGFTPGKAVGRLMLNGVDVSRQMLRDGAAWHMDIATSGQRQEEFDMYAEAEALARQEKRGVWSVAGLEPAWQFRAKAKQVVMNQQVRSTSFGSNGGARRKGYWSDTNPWLKHPGAIAHGYNAATQTGYLATLMGSIKDDKAAAAGQKTAVNIIYYYTEKGKNGRTGYFILQVISLADENFRFLKSNSMTVDVDGKKFGVGKPRRLAGKQASDHAEQLTYRVDRSIVEKITNGANVVLKIGDYSITPLPVLQMRLHTMLQSAK